MIFMLLKDVLCGVMYSEPNHSYCPQFTLVYIASQPQWSQINRGQSWRHYIAWTNRCSMYAYKYKAIWVQKNRKGEVIDGWGQKKKMQMRTWSNFNQSRGAPGNSLTKFTSLFHGGGAKNEMQIVASTWEGRLLIDTELTKCIPCVRWWTTAHKSQYCVPTCRTQHINIDAGLQWETPGIWVSK
jgi:hypothetical protein